VIEMEKDKDIKDTKKFFLIGLKYWLKSIFVKPANKEDTEQFFCEIKDLDKRR